MDSVFANSREQLGIAVTSDNGHHSGTRGAFAISHSGVGHVELLSFRMYQRPLRTTTGRLRLSLSYLEKRLCVQVVYRSSRHCARPDQSPSILF